MSSQLKRISRSLYWRIASIFLLVFLVLTGIYFYIVTDTAKKYFQESSQNLNRPVAARIAKEPYLFQGGTMNRDKRDSLFHDAMVLNPSLEIYVLDLEGNVLDFNAPDSLIVQRTVELAPVHAFLADTSGAFFAGQDPRHPGELKPFSAAKVVENGELAGFVYVVLQSDIYTSVTEDLQASYMLGLGLRSMVLVLVIALALGLVMLYFLTRNLRQIVRVVRRFRSGDLNARIDLRSRGELTQLAKDFNKMADTIVQNINEIKSVEKLRRELISNVSHDLRTPIAAIQGYAETLLMKIDKLSREDQIKYTEVILNGSQRLRKLVEDLFELSKLEALETRADFEEFSIQELVGDISMKYKILADAKRIGLSISVPTNPIQIYADIALLDRAIQNLVDNALKNTPEGGSISISVEQVGERTKILVEDTGVGIHPDELPYIFDRYMKVGQKRRDGAGLGLAIVKKIVELHSSEIKVQSKLDEGTVFWFELPVFTVPS